METKMAHNSANLRIQELCRSLKNLEVENIRLVLENLDLQAKVTWLEYLLDLYQVPREVKLSDEAQREANNVPVAWG